jgi:enterochelin esterase-like enzyme
MKSLKSIVRVSVSVVALAGAASSMLAQAPPANFQSTEIHPDRTVTFRYVDPYAPAVTLSIRDLTQPISMHKGTDGIWTATTQPLPPAIYNYHFEVEKQWRLDPANPSVAVKYQNVTNLLPVPGATLEPWDPADVPHGEVHHHMYTSHTVLHLPQDQSEYYVYTPPGYDAHAAQLYPVLYLLSGFNEGPWSWTAVGRANIILDNLIAQHKAQPMVVVMPLGYGDMDYVLTANRTRDPKLGNEHYRRFEQALLTEVLPRVESSYHVAHDREHRAIAGLSMGGHESLSIGLTHTSQFAYVIGLSAAAAGIAQDAALANLNPKAANLRLLWVSCGTDDSLSAVNHDFVDWLHSKGMTVNYVQTPGTHTWSVWQNNLVHFAPLLFQPK